MSPISDLDICSYWSHDEMKQRRVEEQVSSDGRRFQRCFERNLKVLSRDLC